MDNRIDNEPSLIVLGMHRSGTSLISQWLHSMGLNMGKELLGENFSNVHGHFENVDFINYHELQLEKNLLPIGGLKINHFNPLKILINEEELAKLIDSQDGQWGMKDPRTCLFIHKYPKLENTVFLITYRNAYNIADSLVRREKKRVHRNYQLLRRIKKPFHLPFQKNKIRNEEKYREDYIKDWIIYNQQIIDFTKKLAPDRFIVVDADELLTSNDKLIAFLKQNKFNLNYNPINSIFDKTIFSKEKEFPKSIHDNKIEELTNILKKMSVQ